MFVRPLRGGGGRVVLIVMVVERVDAIGTLNILQILVSCSQFCYVVLCVSYVKMIVNTYGF
jgi:hypothetical protein